MVAQNRTTLQKFKNLYSSFQKIGLFDQQSARWRCEAVIQGFVTMIMVTNFLYYCFITAT